MIYPTISHQYHIDITSVPKQLYITSVSHRYHIGAPQANFFTQDVPRDATRDVPRDVPRNATRDVPRDVPHDIPRAGTRDIPRDVPPDVPRDVPRDVPPTGAAGAAGAAGVGEKVWRHPATAESSRTASLARTTRARRRNRNRYPGWVPEGLTPQPPIL